MLGITMRDILLLTVMIDYEFQDKFEEGTPIHLVKIEDRHFYDKKNIKKYEQ